MVKICNISDLSEVNKFINRWDKNCVVRLRNILIEPHSFVISDEDQSMYLLIEARSPRVAIIHMYCDKQSRGKKMIKFIKEVKEWVRDNTELEFFFNYTKDKKAKFIMNYTGSKSIGIYRGFTVFKQTIKR
jgi:hypothetical protein